VDGLLPTAVGVGDHDVRLDPLVAHGQHRDPGPPAVGQRGRDLRERIAGVEHPGPDQVGGEVAVAEAEPRRIGAVGGQFLLDRPGLGGAAPAALLVDAAAQGVDDRVEIRADAQAVQRDVVAGVDHRRDLPVGCRGASPAQKSSPSHPSREDDDLHESHGAVWQLSTVRPACRETGRDVTNGCYGWGLCGVSLTPSEVDDRGATRV
jgi:hypothetical protein